MTTIETGRPLCWPSFPEAISAQPGQQPVVVALGLAAGVAVDGGRIGGGVDDRGVVVGVGRAGGGQFG
nr:hypothetical protein [Mycobacterium tuberculosis]